MSSLNRDTMQFVWTVWPPPVPFTMGWLRSVGSIKLQVSFAEYCLFYRALLQKRPVILSILLTKATPYHHPSLSWQGERISFSWRDIARESLLVDALHSHVSSWVPTQSRHHAICAYYAGHSLCSVCTTHLVFPVCSRTKYTLHSMCSHSLCAHRQSTHKVYTKCTHTVHTKYTRSTHKVHASTHKVHSKYTQSKHKVRTKYSMVTLSEACSWYL